MVRVGLAMLQGARHEHAEALREPPMNSASPWKSWNVGVQNT